jgi:hypothetical protein
MLLLEFYEPENETLVYVIFVILDFSILASQGSVDIFLETCSSSSLCLSCTIFHYATLFSETSSI